MRPEDVKETLNDMFEVNPALKRAYNTAMDLGDEEMLAEIYKGIIRITKVRLAIAAEA